MRGRREIYLLWFASLRHLDTLSGLWQGWFASVNEAGISVGENMVVMVSE
jgi:hypothetical protein